MAYWSLLFGCRDSSSSELTHGTAESIKRASSRATGSGQKNSQVRTGFGGDVASFGGNPFRLRLRQVTVLPGGLLQLILASHGSGIPAVVDTSI